MKLKLPSFSWKKINIFFYLSLLFCLLTGCQINSSVNQHYFIDKNYFSKIYNSRVDYIIIHYTAENNKDSLSILSQSNDVSVHYLIPFYTQQHQNMVYQLVDESNSAWHAGVSHWGNHINLNKNSIGIEIVNKGFIEDINGEKKWFPYQEKQIKTVIALSKDIIERHHIKPDHILAHSDIAPLRKNDPGKLFPWKKLAEEGIGAWPDEDRVSFYLGDRQKFDLGNILVIQKSLKLYGYTQIPQTGILDEISKTIISAFQMHFRPDDISGIPDAETEAIALALLEKYKKIYLTQKDEKI